MSKTNKLLAKLDEYYKQKQKSEKKQVQNLPNERGEKHFIDTDAILPIVVDKSEFEDVVVFVLTDLHVGSSESEFERAERILEVAKNTPNAVIIVNGDMINNAIVGSKSDTLSQALNIVPSAKKVFDLLNNDNVQDKIVVNALGNHEARTSRIAGIEPTMLYGVEDEKYAKGIYLIEIQLKNKNEKEKGPAVYTILGSHGKMAKGRGGASIDALLNFASTYSVMPDLVVAGHVHQNVMGRGVSFVRNPQRNNKIEKKKTTVAVVPPGIPTELYALEKNYSPSNTDLAAFVTEQWIDKGATAFNTNTASLDKLFAVQNLLSSEELKRAQKLQANLRRAETKIVNSLIDESGKIDVKLYEKYLLYLANQADKLGKEFGKENEFSVNSKSENERKR